MSTCRQVTFLHCVRYSLHLKVHLIIENLRIQHDLVETVINNDYMDMCIDAINEHGKDDPEFQK